jgi:hypothetical protein
LALRTKREGSKEGRKEENKKKEQENGTIKYTRINKWKDVLRRCKLGNTYKNKIRQKYEPHKEAERKKELKRYVSSGMLRCVVA